MSDTRTPLDLLQAYKAIPVKVWEEDSWKKGKPAQHAVSLNTYLIGKWTKEKKGGRSVWKPRSQHREKQSRTFLPWYKKHKDLAERTRKQGDAWTIEDQNWYDANEWALWRAANGKGFPEDIATALEW